MNSSELLAAAYKANPEYIEKTANALVVLEQWEPEFAAELMSDINTITSITLEKTAGFGELAGKAALGIAGGVGLGVAGAVAGDLYDASKRALTKGTNLRRIMINNPELQRADKKALISSFNTLHRYAPDFTADPMLGGQLLTKMVELPHDQYNLVKEMLGARKTLGDSKRNQFSLGKPEFGSKPSLAERTQDAMENAQIEHDVRVKFPKTRHD